MADVYVTGLADLQKVLNQFPVKVETNIMRGALRAGAVEIRKEALRLVPVGPPSSEGKRLYGGYQGALRDSIRITTRRRGRRINASVMAGGKTKKGADVFYAHMIEYGAKQTPGKYRIPSVTSQVKRLLIGGQWVSSVMHPPLRAQPFMRPALDRTNRRAIVAAGNYIKRRLATKHGINTAHIRIEGDE